MRRIRVGRLELSLLRDWDTVTHPWLMFTVTPWRNAYDLGVDGGRLTFIDPAGFYLDIYLVFFAIEICWGAFSE